MSERRKQVEVRQDARSGEELALLVDAVRDCALFLLSPAGEIRTWNSGAERIFGYSADQVRGKPFSMFYTAGDRAAGKPEEELEVAAREGRVEEDGWRVRSDGTRFRANTIITTLRGEDDHLRGFAKITRDLTEQATANEELRRSEELFELLVSSVKDYAIFMLDPAGHVMTWNEGARRIKGYHLDEVIGRHFSMFYEPKAVEAGRPQSLLRAAREVGQVEDEGWRLRKDGTRFWANVLITAVHDAEGELRGFAKVTRDITEKRRAEEVQRALQEQREARRRADQEKRMAEASSKAAQEASRAKDEFLMMLSHELRTPLTSILGWSRLLTAVDPMDETMKEGLESIARSAELQARLIDDVLDISRIVAGKFELKRETVNLSRQLHEAAELVRTNAREKKIQLRVEIADDLAEASIDPVRLQQIIWNLLSNAVKFSPEGGTVTLEGRRSKGNLVIVVEDEGPGIPADSRSAIFQAFRQIDMSVKREHGGLGLGLAIVRHLVEAHGGDVDVDNIADRGTRFVVTMPVEGGTDVVTSTQERVEGTESLDDQLQGKCVVVVDDDRETLRLLGSTLEKAGAEVQAVSSASEAIAACGRKQPDLVLTDIGLPEESGVELLEELRNSEAMNGTLFVAITAFDFAPSDVQKFDDAIRKPVDPFELVDRLAALLDR